MLSMRITNKKWIFKHGWMTVQKRVKKQLLFTKKRDGNGRIIDKKQ